MLRRPILPLLAMAASLSACAVQAPHPAASGAVVPQPAVAPAPPPSPVTPPLFVEAGPARTGVASWYEPMRGLHRTYTGAVFTGEALSAASPTLPMGTMVRVSMLDSDDSVVVEINDRMPHGHRLIDLSKEAARELGLLHSGVARVIVTPIRLADVQD